VEEQAQELQLRVEGVGVLRISLIDGSAIGLTEILDKVTGHQALQIAQMTNTAGEAFEQAGNFVAAAKAYAASYQLAGKSGDRLNTAAIMINLGLALKKAERFDDALVIYNEASGLLQQPEEAPDAEARRTGLLACVLMNTALLALAMGTALDAERAANWCLDLVRYLDDDASKSMAARCNAVLQDAERTRQKAPPAASLVVQSGSSEK
jgi:hypothetical protein